MASKPRPSPSSSPSSESHDFWDMLDDLLKKHIVLPQQPSNVNTTPQARRAAIMRLMQKEHVDYVSSLSLDEIEAMTKKTEEAKSQVADQTTHEINRK